MRGRASICAWLVLASACGGGAEAASATTVAPVAAPAPTLAADADAAVTLRFDELAVESSRASLGATEQGVDEPRLTAFLHDVAPRLARDAAPGHIDLASRTVVPDIAARALDVPAARAYVIEALARGEREIVVPVTHTPLDPAVVPEGLSLAEVVGEFTTPLSRRGGHRHRAHNVDLATAKLNRVIIPARGTLSFNGVVGPRDRASGYRYAPIILDGELQPGIGGGICQAASTLHAAAFFGGLEFDAYQNHSRVSSYIDGGLDATVVWPNVDLVVRNPFDFPLYVTAETAEDSVTVRIYGRARPRTVTWTSTRLPGARAEVREILDNSLPAGARVRTQGGHGGRTVDRTRTLTEGDRTWQERERIVYSPVPEIVRVGTGPLR